MRKLEIKLIVTWIGPCPHNATGDLAHAPGFTVVLFENSLCEIHVIGNNDNGEFVNLMPAPSSLTSFGLHASMMQLKNHWIPRVEQGL